MPTGVLQRYLEGLADEQVLELRDEIALVDARSGGLFSQLNDSALDHARESSIWKEIRELIHERQRLVESARRRLKDLKSTITVEEASAMVEALTLTVQRNVPDPHRRRVIAKEVEELLKPMQLH